MNTAALIPTRNLWLRVLSALILIPIALIATWYGENIFAAVLLIVTLLGLREWLRLVAPEAPHFLVGLVMAMVIAVMIVAMLVSPAAGAVLMIFFTLILFLTAAHLIPDYAGLIALSLPYVGGGTLALLHLRMHSGLGDGLVYYLFATVWGTDIGAYVAGRVVGGPKLVPDISPSKTWSGLVGGIICAALAGYFISTLVMVENPFYATGLAAILAIVSQLGDLFESYIKRRAGAKDSGGLIPGHGGILDRVDGLIFAALFLVAVEQALSTAEIRWWL